MPAARQLTGKRFGRLTVLQPTDKRSWGAIVWLCECECGNLTEIPGRDLTDEHTQSCGCLNRDVNRKRMLNDNPMSGIDRTGDKNPCWRGGTTPDSTLLRNSEQYAEWRTNIFMRDNHRCIICGNGRDLQAHHLDDFSSHPDKRFSMDNGVTLCVEHHKQLHAYFGYNTTRHDFYEFIAEVHNDPEVLDRFWEAVKGVCDGIHG